MQLPFTREQFFHVFGQYNQAVWPMQWFLLAVAVLLLVLVLARRDAPAKAVYWPLALLWFWMAVAYHWLFFRAINPAAPIFGLMFLLQGGLFVVAGWGNARLVFRRRGWRFGWGLALVGYALVIYPLLNRLLDQNWPQTVTFGLPCPTTIFTLGLLAMLEEPGFRRLIVVPLLWCFVGSSAAFMVGVPQDMGLVAAGALVLAMLLFRSRPSGGDVI